MRTSSAVVPSKLSKNGFPVAYRRLSPLKKLQWLQSAEAQEMLALGALNTGQIEAQVNNLSRNDRRVAAIVPSPACLDQYRDGHPFPPPAEHTPMKRAVFMLRPERHMVIENQTFTGELDVYWPAHTLTADGCTYDLVADWIDRTERAMDLPSSHRPSGRVTLRLKEECKSIIPVALEPEDEQSLKNEIRDFQLNIAETVPGAHS